MYKLFIGLLLFSVGGLTLAAEPSEEASSEITSADSQPDTSEKGGSPKPAPPVTTFTPSEKVSADSAVSFPVDI